MTVRTATLAVGSSAPANAEHVIYTCPSGRTAILKDLRLYSGAGATKVAVFIETSGAARVSIVVSALAADSTDQRQGFIVLEPGSKVGLYSEGGTFVAWLSGSELDGVAP